MTEYGRVVHVAGPFERTVEHVRGLLAVQGFGVLTEIDVQATLRAKLGVDVPRQLILGACNPSFAHRALEVEPMLGLLLPCNVVVREDASGAVQVAAVDPRMLVAVTGNEALRPVAEEVATRLDEVMSGLEHHPDPAAVSF